MTDHRIRKSRAGSVNPDPDPDPAPSATIHVSRYGDDDQGGKVHGK
jgi:hypothetical protein